MSTFVSDETNLHDVIVLVVQLAIDAENLLVLFKFVFVPIMQINSLRRDNFTVVVVNLDAGVVLQVFDVFRSMEANPRDP